MVGNRLLIQPNLAAVGIEKSSIEHVDIIFLLVVFVLILYVGHTHTLRCTFISADPYRE